MSLKEENKALRELLDLFTIISNRVSMRWRGGAVLAPSNDDDLIELYELQCVVEEYLDKVENNDS